MSTQNTKMSIENTINYLTGNPRMMLLIDAIGAFFTAFMLGIVLTNYTDVFGMPKNVLQPLAIAALCFALYSFIGYLFTNTYKPYIRVIAFANLCYCLASTIITVKYYQSLSISGIMYFIGEIAIILSMVYIELRVANSIK